MNSSFLYINSSCLSISSSSTANILIRNNTFAYCESINLGGGLIINGIITGFIINNLFKSNTAQIGGGLY